MRSLELRCPLWGPNLDGWRVLAICVRSDNLSYRGSDLSPVAIALREQEKALVIRPKRPHTGPLQHASQAEQNAYQSSKPLRNAMLTASDFVCT